jgi:hypothetical protein
VDAQAGAAPRAAGRPRGCRAGRAAASPGSSPCGGGRAPGRRCRPRPAPTTRAAAAGRRSRRRRGSRRCRPRGRRRRARRGRRRRSPRGRACTTRAPCCSATCAEPSVESLSATIGR